MQKRFINMAKQNPNKSYIHKDFSDFIDGALKTIISALVNVAKDISRTGARLFTMQLFEIYDFVYE